MSNQQTFESNLDQFDLFRPRFVQQPLQLFSDIAEEIFWSCTCNGVTTCNACARMIEAEKQKTGR